jgi:hypothetical protein
MQMQAAHTERRIQTPTKTLLCLLHHHHHHPSTHNQHNTNLRRGRLGEPASVRCEDSQRGQLGQRGCSDGQRQGELCGRHIKLEVDVLLRGRVPSPGLVRQVCGRVRFTHEAKQGHGPGPGGLQGAVGSGVVGGGGGVVPTNAHAAHARTWTGTGKATS